MPGHDNISAPHTDRYGHPEAVNRITLTPGSYDHGVAALHCDRYGHVEGNDPKQKVAYVVNQGETKQTLIGKLGKLN